MIGRYTRPEMGGIWEDENRFRIWLEIEVLACEAQAQRGIVPEEAVMTIRSKAAFSVERILEIEREVKHDVIAFLTNVGESVGPDARFIHLGMTSSDVLDTALAVQMDQSAALLLSGLTGLRDVLARRAKEFKYTVMVGRTHGVHAEPVTFGLKLALWYAEVSRNIYRLTAARKRIAVGQISGAVGTYAYVDPFVEAYVCRKLGLEPAPISTQVIQRDRHAEFLNVLAVCGCTLEKIATEIRHLQKTEVLEAEEFFSKGQKGSSAMPHKRNPITCERIAGLSRVLRGNALAGMENVALWHERDITHSSVERIVIPDSCILLDFMLHETTRVIDKLVVYPDNMTRNLERTRGLIFSQSLLLALMQKGMSREDAYAIVQRLAMTVWETKVEFSALARGNEAVKQFLSDADLEALFDPKKSTQHVDYIFEQVGLK
ncbi:MAG: adenylosuccinate lyase [Ignavibacteria bacterium]|nr:adenylosuccinate lyase [Ignavibacteria bacterium]